MLYCFINNVHVDYTELLLEWIYSSLLHPTSVIHFPRFTKIIVDHYMNENPNSPRRQHEHYYRVENDEVNVDTDEFMDEIINKQEDLGTRIEPIIDKESSKVKKSADMLIIHDDKEEEESELMIFAQDAPSSLDKEKLKELTVTDPTPSSSLPNPKSGCFKRYKSLVKKMGRHYGYLFKHLKKTFMSRKSFHELAAALQSTLKEVLPPMVDSFLRNYMKNNILHVYLTPAASLSTQDIQYQLYLKMKDDEQVCNANLSIWWSLKIKFKKPATSTAPCRMVVVRTRDHEDHHNVDARPEGESKKISGEINKAQWHKPINEMLRQRCNSREELHYHVDQMQNYLKSDTVWESGPKKYTLSLNKYPKVPFLEDHIEEQTLRWMSKQIKRFNVYARYSVEHGKNL
nr:hypothetical protein [Tanacetum cinerariifolium]